MPTDQEIKKALEDIKNQPAQYPPELYTATKGEFVTRVRTNQPKKPGCPLMGGAILLIIIGILNIIF